MARPGNDAAGGDASERLARGCVFFLALLVWGISARADPDLWWHLRLGDEILRTGIPTHDLYSFTFRGHPLIDHEWLTQPLLSGLYRLGGIEALNFSFAFLAALVFWLVYRRAATGVHTYFAMSISLVAALGSTFIFGTRPQLFTLLGLGLILWVIDRVRTGRLGNSWFWVFPILTVAWANLHGGVFMGIAVMLLYATGDSLDRLWPGTTNGCLSVRDSRRLFLVSGVSLLATAANPYGYDLWALPFQEALSGVNRDYILEWMPPDLREPRFVLFGALLAIGLPSLIWNRARPYVSECVLVLGTGFLGLLSIRHIPLFLVAATPVICRRLWPALCRIPLGRALQLDLPGARSGLARSIIAGFIVVVAVAAATNSSYARLSRIPSNIEREYPVKAVDFITTQGLDRHRGLNEYRWGGYLIWRDVPVLIDGRANTLYDARFLARYFRVYALEEPLEPFLRDLSVEYALIRSSHGWGSIFAAHPDWAEVYRDDDAIVFVARPEDR
jgi:hypothetical protein